MINPTLGDIEVAVDVLRREAERSMEGPLPNYNRRIQLDRIANALERLLPRSRQVDLSKSLEVESDG